MTSPATRAVIADSDAGRRLTLSKIVRQLDPEAVVLEAVSGEELSETIVRHQPSLGFVSMQLSRLSGPEAVALARKRGAVLPCLVVVSSRVFRNGRSWRRA
ncbi:CheY-like chemotaxis protein [Methylobacterium sp. BE186]|uniref:hypothetical protein n=1 Tax=Methylobacterium sp. BE186 TaxID=2817715 RepID=UPI0028590789|nr:hypothetical protein [Methylobacterium sp. BE186]MDR7040383.1 CheY-like chemotaxis protein [Methylobacterium sp. BE186]